MSTVNFVTNLHQDYSIYKKLGLPFDKSVWISIAIVTFSGFIVLFVIRRFSRSAQELLICPNNKSPYYNIITTMLGSNVVGPLPRRNFARFLLIMWLLLTFVLRNAYNSGFFYILREKVQTNPPSTINDVIKQQYAVYLSPQNRRILRSLPEIKKVKFFNITELESFSYLENYPKKVAIITQYEYFGYYRKLRPMNRKLNLVQEKIITQQLSMYFKRHSYLMRSFNKNIDDFVNCGLLDKYAKEYMMDSTRYKAIYDSKSIILTMDHLLELFHIYVIANTLAAFVFFVEILVFKFLPLKL